MTYVTSRSICFFLPSLNGGSETHSSSEPYSTPSKQWFIQLLPQALFLLVHLLYRLITSQRNHLMLMEYLLYQKCLHQHLLSLLKEQKEKNLHQEKSLYHTLAQLPHLQPLDSTSAPPAPTSAISVSSVSHSPIPPLRQDPNLLRQFLPALQAVLQLHNSNVDTSIINEVLRAAVTRASLPSIIHNFLTVGPSAFNITSLISQAAQLPTQAQPSNQSPCI